MFFLRFSLIFPKFQVANKKDFSDSITVATIGDFVECRFNELTTSNLGKYRYFRYLSSANSNSNMAEVEVYDGDGNQILTGRPFDDTKKNTVMKLFDGDVLTYCTSYKAQNNPIWAALEFEKPESVVPLAKRFCLLVRPRGNPFIGQAYEPL